VLLSRFPYPLEKGDKLRAYHQIRQLSQRHEIHLCALNDSHLKEESIKAVQPYCKSIHILNLSKFTVVWNIMVAFFNGKPLQVGYFYNKHTQRKVDKLIDEIKPDHIYCQLLRVAEYVRKKKIRKTLDYQDVFSKGMDRRKETAPFYLKPLFEMEYKRLCKYENALFDDFDNKTIISYPDRDFIPHPDRNKIVVVTNGVDSEYFKPIASEKKYDLIFTGNMGYPPNVNAACFLVNEILPRVRKIFPHVSLVLAGASPNAQVLELRGEKIDVTGWTEDIRDYYAAAKIFIAPMKIGTGLQNKLLEAMAMKIPCITSALANNALSAKNGEEIMVGQTAQEFADLVIDLLTHPVKAAEIAQKGYTFVYANFNWESATAKLDELIIKS
jgi:sugar transferase (PEP-CTERM/EpsH1 system associated)